MRRLFKLRREAGRIERELRAERPEPRTDFLLSLTKQVNQSRLVRRRRASSLAFALALTTFVIGTFASFGGIGYAASGATSAVNVVKKAVADHPRTLSNRSTSAQQQYTEEEAPTQEQQVAAQETAQVAGAQNLPFTGISLAVTVALGLALLAAGLILRRAEARSDGKRRR
jgi:hypothetical protein